MQEVRKERTGWRDEGLSLRHRDWGWDCPAIDVDFLMVEYNHGRPIAVVEYKHEYAPPVDIKHPSYRAISELATLAKKPFFVVRYTESFQYFDVLPVNDEAKNSISKEETVTMSEYWYVRFLYHLRGHDGELPNDVLVKMAAP